MSVYTKSIQETNYVTVENHQPTTQICNLQNVVLQVQMWLSDSWNVMKDNGLMTSQ